MKNSKENAEKFLWEWGGKGSFVDKLNGVPDIVDLLMRYANVVENKVFPNGAHSFEVFAIKDCEESPTGKEAYIGCKLANGNFHFVGVPFTEPYES